MSSKSARAVRFVRPVLVSLAFVAGVVVLLLWLVGAFRPKVADQGVGVEPRLVGSARTVKVEPRRIPRVETAVGSIQPVHRTEIASRLLARVVEVRVAAGQKVATGDVIAMLEDTDLRSRRAQALAAIDQAQSTVDQLRIEESRIAEALASGAANRIELDRAANARKGAEANLDRARQSLAEAESVLGFATIRSPIDGVVVDKRVQPGDTVAPGQVVATVLDPTRMQLVATVRESLSRQLRVGGEVMVSLDVVDHACAGTVSEIVPEAESTSRTFEVKVTGPCPEGVYAGMFGRLAVPVGDEDVLLVPRAAVRGIGQVDMVDVAVDGRRVRRAVRIGRTIEGELEILSGLSAGELVIVDAAATGAEGR